MKWIEFSMYGTFSGNKVWSKSPIPHFDIYYIFRFKWILKKQKNDLWFDNIEYVNRMERYKNVGFVFIFTPANNQCNLRKRPTDTIIVMLRMHVRFHVCGHQNVIQSAKSSRSFFFCFFFCLRYHERRNHSVEQSCASVSTAYSLASLVHTIQIVNLNMK